MLGRSRRFRPPGLNLAVNQGEVMHQFHPGGGGQGWPEVSGQRLAGGHRHRPLEVEDGAAGLRLPLLVHPAQVVPEDVVEEALAAVKDRLQFLCDRLLVLRVPGDQFLNSRRSTIFLERV